MLSPTETLEVLYNRALQEDGQLTPEQLAWVEVIVTYAENQKAVLTVTITSLTKKIENPKQDTRQHKVELSGGYSGRSYDTNYITPFMRSKFPRLAVSESGWLTRSLEQAHAFDFNFPGRISNKAVKQAFLNILHDIEENEANPSSYLLAILHRLITKYQPLAVSSASIETIITIQHILDLLSEHFFTRYYVAGGARLPVLAVYSIYTLIVKHNARYTGKILSPLKSHTTADTKSHGIADIEVINLDETFFEAVEIKHNKPITANMVNYVSEKIEKQKVERYYILTTAEPNIQEGEDIASILRHILQYHGCEVIVNGVLPTLKYYLRLLNNPLEFLDLYNANLSSDSAIKSVHIEKWKDLLQSLDHK